MIIMPYMDFSYDLHEFVRLYGPMNEETARKYVIQILETAWYLVQRARYLVQRLESRKLFNFLF